MLRTNLRDTKRNTPGPLGPGVFGVVGLLVSVTVMVAVVFFLGRLVHHRSLGGVGLQPGHRLLI
ncbi:MAG TPA: hypothetical protein VF328_11635 [Mycobacterium sp.]